MKRLLLLALLWALPLTAQDVTCNAGDIAWVTEDENADEGIVGGGSSAEYGNSAAAWGIQAVYDESCAGLLVHIVVGTNNYNSSSTSWNNRDAADKTINLDVVAGTGDLPIVSIGYSALDGSPALATLDFDSALITGAHGFQGTGTADFYVWNLLRFTDTDDDAFETAGTDNHFIDCEFDNAGSSGLDYNAGNSVVLYSSFHDNAGTGISLSNFCLAFGNEFYDNADDGIIFFTRCAVVSNLVYGNTNDGLEVAGDGNLVALNTVKANGDNGIEVGGSSEHSSILENVITGQNGAGDIGLASVSGSAIVLVRDNNYGDNTTAQSFGGAAPSFNDDSSPETTVCTFVSATDLEVTANCTFTKTFPRATTSTTVLKGAVQNSSGGGSTTIITQGVSF